MGQGYTLITSSATKNSTNATIGGVGILLSSTAAKSLTNIETITSRIMIATFSGNPQTTVIFCYSPTNTAEEKEVEDFYGELTSLIRQVPKHNVLIIGGDFNAKVGRTDGFTFAYHETTNRNRQYLTDLPHENNLTCLNTRFQKTSNKTWSYTYPNEHKAQLDYIIINNKWKNSAHDCESTNKLNNVFSGHRVVTATLQLSLRANKPKTKAAPRYDWSVLEQSQETSQAFKITVKNKIQILQDQVPIASANDTYENFVKACGEAAEEHIPLKPKLKRKAPWENEAIEEKRQKLEEAIETHSERPTRTNTTELKKARQKLKSTYQSEQQSYLNSKIKDIEDASANEQSATAWQIVNEISGRKTTNKAKLKAADNEERVSIWQSHFQKLYGKPPDILDEPTQQIINHQLNIETGPFTCKELEEALAKTKNKKACGLDGIPPEVWKTKHFNEELLTFCNKVYDQEAIKRWTEGCILPFPKKGDLGDVTNYRGITLTSIAAKIYNQLLLNRIRPQLENVLRRNQNGFRQNRSTVGQILTIRRLIEEIKKNNLKATLLFVDFSKAFDSIHRGKMEEIPRAYGIPNKIVKAIMMLYKNTRSLVRSPDGDTDFFEILAGVLQGDTVAPYLFIICLGYVLRTSADKNNDLGFTLIKARSRRYPAKTLTDIDYADDLALTSAQQKKRLNYFTLLRTLQSKSDCTLTPRRPNS